MLKTGVVSTIFRNLSVEEVIQITSNAHLDAIEWDGDVHVPLGDLDKAAIVRQMTESANLSICSYGSFFKLGENTNFEYFKKIVATAKALNAKAVRVLSNFQKKYLDDMFYKRLVLEAKILADYAKKENIKVSLQFQLNQSMDFYESINNLLIDVNHDNLVMHFTDNELLSLDDNLKGVKQLLKNIYYVNVKYNINKVAYPLIQGINLWNKYVDEFKQSHQDIYLLIDALKDNDIKQFNLDAKIVMELANKSL